MSVQTLALIVADLCCDLAGANKTAGATGNSEAFKSAEVYYQNALKILAAFNGPMEKRYDVNYDLIGIKAMLHKHQEAIDCATYAMQSKESPHRRSIHARAPISHAQRLQERFRGIRMPVG